MKQITEEKNKHHHTQDSIQTNLLTGIYRGLLIASLATGIRYAPYHGSVITLSTQQTYLIKYIAMFCYIMFLFS